MQRLLDQHPEFNEWRLAFLSPLPWWLLVLVIALLAAAVVAAHLGLRGERRRGRRVLLTSLRGIAALAAAFLLLEPAIQLLEVQRIKNRVAVLLDTSSSMSLPAGSGDQTRLESAQELLRSDPAWFASLSDRFVFEHATFDSALYPSDQRRLLSVEHAEGRTTDLMAALGAVARSSGAGGRRLAGVLLLTDGVDTETLAGGMTSAARRELEELGAPVHVFQAGSEDDIKDIAITRVEADEFAFVRNAVEVDVVIQSRGFPARDIPVVLRREGRAIATKTVRIAPGEESRASFRFTPDTTGRFIYTVEVPVLSGEAVTTNNRRSFVLKVIRDRVRVLQVAGRPSWDQRFLRGLFKKDPNVDLISFFILRTPRNTHQVHNSELSLIPFPTHELFTQELSTFDLVVFQNFDYLPYQMAQYLGNIRRYVEEGGSFVMIGGEKSFSEGRYQGTYIEDILPVELLPARSGTVDAEPFGPRLTEHGRRHPITQVSGAGESLDRVFDEGPELPGFNRVRRVRRDAQVLLEHPFRRGDVGGGAPVVVVGEAKRGRTMAVMTDGTWFWSFPAAGGDGDRRVYDRFWTNAMRWLVRDPDLTNVRVRPRRETYEPTDTPVVEVDVRDRDYGAAKGARVRLEVRSKDYARHRDLLGEGTPRPIPTAEGDEAAGQSRVSLHDGVAGEDGTATFELDELPGTGPFKVIAEAFGGENDLSLGSDEGAFVISETAAQMVDPAPRADLLREIASITDGSLHKLPRSGIPPLSFVDPEVVEVGRKQNHDIWDRWGWLALLIGAIAAEWSLRRRWGHL